MSIPNGGFDATTATAIAAANAQRRRLMQEEEEMTDYTPKDLAEGWEFKILRANTAVFRKPERLRAILEEEKRGGWTLVEKFDDNRIRLKRPVSLKVVEEDLADGYDPYRTRVGLSDSMAGGMMAALIIGGIFGGFVMVVFLLKLALG
jgi:hypothetical protein